MSISAINQSKMLTLVKFGPIPYMQLDPHTRPFIVDSNEVL
jgi:hypothetical protein